MNSDLTKLALRRSFLKKRHALSEQEHEDMSFAIANNCLKLPIWHLDYYHLYLPIKAKAEIDTTLILTLFSENWESPFPIDAHVIASGLAKSKFDRRYLNCENPKKSNYYISKNVEYKQWRTIKNQDGIFKRLKNDPQVVTFINGKTTLLPKKWRNTRVGHNFSILVVSDIILSDLQKSK